MSVAEITEYDLAKKFRDVLLDTMRKEGVTKAEMARRMGVTRGYASMVCATGAPTTVAKWLKALGYDVNVEVKDARN